MPKVESGILSANKQEAIEDLPISEEFYGNMTGEQRQEIEGKKAEVVKKIADIPRDLAVKNLTKEQMIVWSELQSGAKQESLNPETVFRAVAEWSFSEKRLQEAGIEFGETASEKTQENLSDEEAGKREVEETEKIRLISKESGVSMYEGQGFDRERLLFEYAILKQLLKREAISEDDYKEEFNKPENGKSFPALDSSVRKDRKLKDLVDNFSEGCEEIIRTGRISQSEFMTYLNEEIDKFLMDRTRESVGFDKGENDENKGHAGLKKRIAELGDHKVDESKSDILRSLERKKRLTSLFEN